MLHKYLQVLKLRKKTNSPDSQQTHWGRWVAGVLAALLAALLLRKFVVLVLLNILAFFLTPILPSIDDKSALAASESTIIYDREGNELYTIHGAENRFEIPLAKMPEYLKYATIAAEDDQFFRHPGFDIDAILRAVLGQLGVVRETGGSTITQQFVKNAYLSPEKSYWRKFQELLLAVKLENNFSKEEILEMYLNRIPYGSNAFGVQAAAETFFGKNAEDLTLAEAVVLAGIPQAPSRYSPYGANRDLLLGHCESEIDALTTPIDPEDKSAQDPSDAVTSTPAKVTTPPACTTIDHPDYVSGRKDYVLRRMLELGFITLAEYDSAWAEATYQLTFQKYHESIAAPHFVFFVREQLERDYGRDLVERGGLRVFTTLDPELQAKAESMISGAFPQKKNPDGTIKLLPNRGGATNGALVTLDNVTGQILAMVGSRDYFETPNPDGTGSDGATNLVTRKRQPGSSFKPFTYAAGFRQGYAPSTVLWDVATDFGNDYKPDNYDRHFVGPISVRRALGGSRNIPAVKMAALAGEKTVVALARDMGLTSMNLKHDYGIAVALGVGEVSPLELATGYSTFANLGKRIDPTPILKVTDSAGNVIEEFEQPQGTVVLEPEMAYLVTHMLSDPGSRPAGWNGYIQMTSRPAAAKTGTANKRFGEKILPGDIWTAGYTPQLTTVAWMGNNDGSPMNQSGEGLTLVAPVWKSFMEFAHTRLPVLNFPRPEGVVQRSVSRLTGKMPSESTPADQIVVDWFADFAVPLEVDDAYTTVTVDTVSGKLPTEYTPESALVQKTFVNLHSERPADPAWEQPVRAWVAGMQEDKDTKTTLILTPPPTEYDDVHTAATARQTPIVSITSPVSGGTVEHGSLGVWVETTAAHGVAKVEYYLDGELVSTATAAPWKGIVPVSKRLAEGARIQIKARVYDQLYYSDQSTVEVTVGADTQLPTVRITTPTRDQSVARGTSLLATAEAFDAGGDIQSVVFELDGSEVARLTSAPYSTSLIIRSTTALGTHRLRVTAVDRNGQSATETTYFEVVNGNSEVADFGLIAPVDGTVVPAGQTSIAVTAQFDRSKIQPLEVEFIARNTTTGNRTTIGRFAEPASEVLSTTWSDFASGEYEIYLKLRLDAEKTLTSGRVRVVVE